MVPTMADLEQLLLQVNHYGKPHLWRTDRGWFCKVDMFVQAKGAGVEIQSEFDHPTPSLAAQTCLERVSAVVRDISKLADHKALTHG